MTDPLFYPRKPKYPFNLTEDQLREAFTLYDAKVKAEIIEKLNNQFNPIDVTEDESILEVIMYAISLATTAGMNMAANHQDVISYYMETRKVEPAVTVYEFEKHLGISGILTEAGKFLKCGNAEHYMLTENMMFSDQIRCVFFSSLRNGDNNGVVTMSPFGSKTFSRAQRMWINEHLIYMDGSQRLMYARLTGHGSDNK